MAKQAGYTFVELLVVVAIVGILSSMSLNILPGIVKPRSLLLESDVLASNIALSISKSKSTQSTFRLLCDPQSVSVNYYSGVRSNSLNTSVGLDAALQTASKPFRSQFFLSPNRKLTIQCPTNCGDVFISSDGLLLTSGVCGSIDFVLAKASSPDALIKLSLSNLESSARVVHAILPEVSSIIRTFAGKLPSLPRGISLALTADIKSE